MTYDLKSNQTVFSNLLLILAKQRPNADATLANFNNPSLNY